MGKRDANVNKLKRIRLGAPKENKDRIDTIIGLYQEGKIPTYITAENLLERLANKTKRVEYTQKTDREYNKIVGKHKDAESVKGKLTREIDAKRKEEENIMITMILFREKEADPKAEKRKSDRETTVNIDFREGVTVDRAQEIKKSVRQAAAKVVDASQDEVVVTGRGRNIKKEVKESKTRHMRDLKQFYIGQFEARVTRDELKWLQDDVGERMLIRKEEATGADFRKVCNWLRKENVIFANLMDSTGDSYLAAVYLMKVAPAHSQINTAFQPKKAKNKNTEKISAYYRFATTELDLEASTFKEAISKHNYVKDECFINSIYDFYRDNLLRADKKRNIISRASILSTIGKTEESVKEGLSIEDVLPFFEKHRLQLRVFDKFYKLVFKHDPPSRNHHNKAMYCLQADGHIYTLNHNLDRLAHQDQESDSEEHIKPRVGETFPIKEEAQARQAKMITNIDDILEVVRALPAPDKKGDKQILTLIHREDDLLKLLYQFVEAGYSPGVNFESGRVTALKLELNSIFCIIETQQLVKSAIDGVVVVNEEQTYNNMNQAMSALNSKLFLKSHLSYYTEQDLEVLDAYRTKPICGMIGPKASKLIEIDISKAYTSAFCDITEIPIFNEFDAFKPYNGEPILPLNLYLVRGDSHPLSTQTHNLVYGKFLTEGLQPLAFKQPSFIKKVDYANLVKELYETKISDNDDHDVYIKKLVANVNIGLLEKCFNRKSVGYLFFNYDECKFYQAQHGGTIHSVQQIADLSKVVERSELGLDDGIEGDTTCVSCFKFEQVGDPIFVLVLKAEKQLRNGFRYIKELLLQNHNFKLREAYDKLAGAGVTVHSVKTDCFTIKAEHADLAKQLLTFGKDFGSWRVSKTKDIIFPFETLKQTQLEDIAINPLNTQQLAVEDEWNTEEMCDHFEQQKRVMVRAEFAGCGKSYACKAMEKRGHKVLFVCPTNKLAQNNRENGVTLNTFFSVGMTDDATQRMSRFDDSTFDVIVFDEIYFASVRMLAKIKRYSESNPSKIILATGDTNQLETIDLISNQLDYETYMDHCINTIFPNNIHLRENKRLKGLADKKVLELFKKQIFDTSIPIETTVRKWFNTTTEIRTTNNIAYRNSTCETVAGNVREMLGKTTDYEVGEVLVCRKYLKLKGGKCSVNFEYTVKAVKGDSLCIEDLSGNRALELKLDIIKKHFIHSYCRTCHSFQGSSINDKITIFDWRFFFVNRKWLYTAVTRATELRNVSFFDGQSEDYDEETLDKYLARKVENYRRQDLDHDRPLTDNFVTPAWLKSQFGKVCQDCGDCLRFDIRGGRVESNLTADRLDNDECHHLNNIVPLCVTCNQRKSCW
jgi:hypothetical protein